MTTLAATSLASLSFAGTDWLWPLLGGVAVAAAWIIASYLRSPGKTSVRALCAALKLFGLAALALCLLEPVWTRARAKPGANTFVILADDSQGMQIRDRSADTTRGEQLKRLLARESWQQSLSDTFAVRKYTFASRLQPVEQFTDMLFDGAASAFGSALRQIGDRFRGQPVAGILLLTDGNATDIPHDFDAAGIPPVFPVVMGSDDALKDIALQRVTTTQTAFEDAPVTIQADVAASGYGGHDIIARLLDGTGKAVDEQKQRAASEDRPLTFRFQVRPAQHGVSFYTMRVGDAREMATNNSSAANTNSSEATLANNSQTVSVNRGHGPHRILYVSGRPNWEFKFLNRAVAGDEEIQIVALIRIAKREPKFEFIGRKGETGNPLFRGFDRQGEEAERYDQPVLIRLNTRDEAELKGGFPKTAEELYAYDAIIVDDLEADFFSRDQMVLAQKFVSERGGALLMLGGAESFRDGKFDRTPIGDMLPAYLDRSVEARPPRGMKLVLTREGWLQPWLRLRNNEAEERTRFGAMPAFDVLNLAHDVKPGASVLATVSDGGNAIYPALVAQRFGNGRTAALMVGDLWLWGMQDEAAHRDMDKAWRQMIRWLVTDVPAQTELHVSQASAADAITLQVAARDKRFQAIDNATVRLTVSALSSGGKATNSIQLTAEPSGAAAGVYTATYIPRAPGAYRVDAVVNDANGAEAGRADDGWASDPAAEEFRSLKPNRALLEKIARNTGGQIVAADKLDAFVRSLPNRKAPVTEAVSLPLWHTPVMFLFALLCFAGEWGLRRWKGLP